MITDNHKRERIQHAFPQLGDRATAMIGGVCIVYRVVSMTCLAVSSVHDIQRTQPINAT